MEPPSSTLTDTSFLAEPTSEDPPAAYKYRNNTALRQDQRPMA